MMIQGDPVDITIRHNVEVVGFDAKIIKNKRDFENFRRLGRMRDSTAFLRYLEIARKAIIFYDRGHNLAVQNGTNWLANIITGAQGTGATSWGYIGVGSGTNAVSPVDSDLQTLISPRLAASYSYPVSNVANIGAFFGANDNAGTWTETGLFSQLANPDTIHPMLARRLLQAAFVKNITNTATVSWTVTFTGI